MNKNENAIIEIILKEKYISHEDVNDALDKSRKSGVPLLSYLLENNYISYDLVGQAMAEHFGVPYADLNTNEPTPEQVMAIPEAIGRKYYAVLHKDDGKAVVVAASNPSNPELLPVLSQIFPGKEIRLAYGIPLDIEKAFFHYKTRLSERFSSIIKSEEQVAPDLTWNILEDAVNLNASDIHFEPRENEILIRFRIDGLLQEVERISYQYYENIVNYMKVLASLRIDEHRTMQDGSFRFNSQSGGVDVRLSIIPTIGGEKMVLRILSKQGGSLSLENIGLSSRDQELFKEAVKKPFGMIVISGPTGSGKTTTLYSLLKVINRPDINITSIEDPVEYVIDSANQIQVNEDAKITFAKGLRSIIRQDPDVIFVGEIRDEETAEIAVNAALTGHLLFSTFHANNAESTFLRLAEMGIENYLLASTLDLVVSQRLLRRICEKCRYSQPMSPEYISRFPAKYGAYLQKEQNFYHGKGCPACHSTGYRGRIAAFEIIRVTPEIQELIVKNVVSGAIWDVAKKQGSKSLFEDAWEKAELGVTTFDEIFRVAPPQ